MNNSKKVANRRPNKFRGKGKGRADDYKSKGRRPYEEDTNTEGGAINNPSYYVDESSSQLTDQLYTFSFNEFLGQVSELGTIMGSNIDYKIPSIMQILVNPSINYTSRDFPASDGINVNALKTFTILASESGRTMSYQQCDPTLAILAIGQVLAQFGVGTRAFGLVGTYNQRNRMFPVWAERACGFDLDELKMNLANYRARFNYLINKFNKVPMFKEIKYFDKCSRMFSQVYLDMSGSSLAQAYAYMPKSTWILDESSNPNGTILKTLTNPAYITANDFGHWVTFGDFLDQLENMVDALLNSTTLNLVYADILRVAMKQGYTLMKLEEVPTNYVLYPVVDEELRMWVNNTIILGDPVNSSFTKPTSVTWTADNDVESDANTGLLHYNPCFAYGDVDPAGFRPIINFNHEAPTVGEKIESTRMYHEIKNTLTVGTSPTYYCPVEVTLTDWYTTDIKIANAPASGIPNVITLSQSWVYNANVNNIRYWIDRWTKFDWHPYIYLIQSGTPNNSLYLIGDLQWFTTLEFDKVKSMDDVAMLNLMKLR